MSKQVTKPKSKGRVAAGKRLAEWNKKQKENSIKNKEQVELCNRKNKKQVKPSGQQELQSSASSQQTVLYSGLAVLAVIGVAIYLYYHEKKQAPATTPAVPELFSMN